MLLADSPFLRVVFFLCRKSNFIKSAGREEYRENLFRFVISYAFYCHSSENNVFYLYVLSHKAQQPSDKKTEEKPVGTPYNEPGQERGEGAPAVNGEKGMKEHFVFNLGCFRRVTGINKGLPERWLEPYVVRKGIVCNWSPFL